MWKSCPVENFILNLEKQQQQRCTGCMDIGRELLKFESLLFFTRCTRTIFHISKSEKYPRMRFSNRIYMYMQACDGCSPLRICLLSLSSWVVWKFRKLGLRAYIGLAIMPNNFLRWFWNLPVAALLILFFRVACHLQSKHCLYMWKCWMPIWLLIHIFNYTLIYTPFYQKLNDCMLSESVLCSFQRNARFGVNASHQTL